MSRQALDELKQQIPLLDYLRAQDWQPVRPLRGGRWMGLCPLHADRKPSFLVDPGKSLFYCYGCGRGGDVIRFAEIYHDVKFPQALVLLRQWRGLAPLLQQATDFYRMQLHRHAEAAAYLYQRGVRCPELIDHMRIGYAPGGGLRAWLMQLGYELPALRQAGLVSSQGYDAYVHRIVFPLEGNLYGRSISASAPPHRFLPGAKGGLYAWEQVRRYPEVILVEGLFDYAVLWQAGFHNLTCSLGIHLNARQFQHCATARAPCISASMPIPAAPASRPRSNSPIVSGHTASSLAASCCPRATIPIPSFSRAVIGTGSSLLWRPHAHEVLRDLPALFPQREKSGPCRRTKHRPRDRLDQSLSGSRVCAPPGG